MAQSKRMIPQALIKSVRIQCVARIFAKYALSDREGLRSALPAICPT